MRQTHVRARGLIDGILEYARSGTSLATESVDTSALVADVAASLANAVAQLNGRLEIAELPVVRGDRAHGYGIGLAVCRKIVEAHGGAIWAEAGEGAGTVMRFAIPAV